VWVVVAKGSKLRPTDQKIVALSIELEAPLLLIVKCSCFGNMLTRADEYIFRYFQGKMPKIDCVSVQSAKIN
jgi:hypothetical protein